MERRILVYGIEWDVDGDGVEALLEVLPKSVVCPPDIDHDVPNDELLDVVGDWLSDWYGFCHKTFYAKYVDVEGSQICESDQIGMVKDGECTNLKSFWESMTDDCGPRIIE